MDLRFTTYETRGRIGIVTIDRPEVRNALHPDAHRELAEIWDAVAADDGVWVAILTGSGDRAFCAGSDLKWMRDNPGAPPWVLHGGPGGFGGLSDRSEFLTPVIGALNGPVFGGGVGLALACDLLVAAEHVVFALPEAGVGNTAGFGAIERVVRQLPEKVALEVILAGRRITAQEALAWGLVNRVVPASEVMDHAVELAERILEASPRAVRANKQIALGAKDLPIVDSSNRIRSAMIELWESSDPAEGHRAFVDKRSPRWEP